MGSTGSVLLLGKEEMWAANAGDSRIILRKKNGAVKQLTIDHKPDDPQEKQRIIWAGGYVQDGRVNRNLNLSRAIGDFDFKRNKNLEPKDQIITSFPDVFHYKLDGDEDFILLGCDGIYETKTNE